MHERFFAIEGIDGVGKGTQAHLLADRLRQEGFPQKLISFPRYETEWGKLIKEYLHGRFGNPVTVNPHIASTFYAGDRFVATPQIIKWMEREERIVVADRYSPSNFAYQGAKIESEEERCNFFNWLWNLEHVRLRAPVPFCIFLDVPLKVSLEWKGMQRIDDGQDLDGHEANADYQAKVKDVYRWLARYLFRYSVTINCCENKKVLAPEAIHDKIWEVVYSKLSS
ncbi:MAG: thymidylate kinase [Patescibacteria group bacterium]